MCSLKSVKKQLGLLGVRSKALETNVLIKFSFKNFVHRSNLRSARKSISVQKRIVRSKILFSFRILFRFRLLFGSNPFFDSTWDPDPGSDLHIVGVLPGTQESFKKGRNRVHVFILEQNPGSFPGPRGSFLIQMPATPRRAKKVF